MQQSRISSASGIIVLIHVGLLVLSVLVASAFLIYPLELGRMSLTARAAIASLAGLLLATGVRPFIPWFSRHLPVYSVLIGLPLLGLGPWYFLSVLPASAGEGVDGAQLASSLITESTSNGIVEVGFAYPIYTPTISLTNNEVFSREVDVYLRVLDGNNDPALFRAVRAVLPDSRLSVEASVHGLLSESAGYLFIPVALPPGSVTEGRVVFIISDLNDGSTFNEALGRSYPAEFQLRDPESGELLANFPMTTI
ncbi:MAG: hypothetical protein KJN90_04515 [Gammaproteobacteria bacterium]|nr:hypothetical protein [Gammaproteobacteria bacterium]